MIHGWIFLLTISSAFAQNLLEEPITTIAGRMKGVYKSAGVFHYLQGDKSSTLKAIRNSFDSKTGKERIVFDFTTDKVPNIYSYIGHEGKKLYIDLQNTKVNPQIDSFGGSKYVESINFIPITADSLPVEIIFDQKSKFDIFHLSSMGRLVIDVKRQ